MAKKKPAYIKRAAQDLEITLSGEETIKELQDLIESEMKSLDTWDGNYFTDKVSEEPPASDGTEAEGDPSTDPEEKTGEPAEEGEEPAGENEMRTAEPKEHKGLEALPEEVVGWLVEELDIFITGDKATPEWREAALEALKEQGGEKVMEALQSIKANQVEAAMDTFRKPQLTDLCRELGLKISGKVAEQEARLAKVDTDQLYAAIETLDLWPEPEAEVSPEAQGARRGREREDKLKELQEAGMESAMKMVNYLVVVEDYEAALDQVDIALDLWPKNTDLVAAHKRLTTQIAQRDEDRSIYERDQHQKKQEKKGIRGRKAKEVTNDQCIDAVNAAIVKCQDMEAFANSQGKAARRYRFAATQMRRIIHNNLRE